MRGTTSTSAASLKAILCFIDPTNTPKIAAIPLIEKIKKAVGDRDGSQSVSISFGEDEEVLANEFHAVCEKINSVFNSLEYCTRERH